MDQSLLLNLYKTALTIRRFEEAAIEQYRVGKIYGYLHPYLGEEAIATGVVPLTHDGIATLTPVASANYIRQLLVAVGTLPGYDHHLDRFERWLPGWLDSITDPEGTMYISMNALQNETVSDFRFQNLWTAKRVYGTAAVYSTFEVSADRLVFKAFSPAGKLRDSFTVIKTKTQAKPFEEPGGPDL